jgi:hypothetical protein
MNRPWHDKRSQRDRCWHATLARLGLDRRRARSTRHTYPSTALMGDVLSRRRISGSWQGCRASVHLARVGQRPGRRAWADARGAVPDAGGDGARRDRRAQWFDDRPDAVPRSATAGALAAGADAPVAAVHGSRALGLGVAALRVAPPEYRRFAPDGFPSPTQWASGTFPGRFAAPRGASGRCRRSRAHPLRRGRDGHVAVRAVRRHLHGVTPCPCHCGRR